MAKNTEPRPQVEQPAESIGDIIRTVVYALLIALVFRTFCFQAFTIPSGSMKPTLLIGDYLLVSKYSYGYSRFSFPYGSRIPAGLLGETGRFLGSTPQRGDVVVFRNPENLQEDYIKRLIGLPGDRVQIIDAVVHINDVPVKLETAESFQDTDPATRCPVGVCGHAIETLDNDVAHSVLVPQTVAGRKIKDSCAYTVPEGHYFFLGDNRDNSTDSRFGHSYGAKIDCAGVFGRRPTDPGPGFVPEENLIGRADVVLFSWDGAFWQLWNWRADRFFKGL